MLNPLSCLTLYGVSPIFQPKIIDRYKIQQADDLQTLDLEEITRNYLPHKKLLELVQSNLEEANVDGVSVDSLNSLEEQLETALSVTRATKTKLMMEFLKTRREKEKLLIEENLVLASKIWKQTFLVTRDETSMLPEYRFGNNPPETLSLLKRKVEIKRIENKSSRQVTFCKRRNGLIEKARQLSVLCGSSVAVLIVSSTGKVYSSSSGDSMAKILKHYEVQHADKLKTLDLTEKTQNYVSLNELLETVQRKIEAANVDNISVQSLIFLEEQFKTALSLTRARKEKLLRDENTVLASQLAEMGKEKEFLETEDERAMLLEYSSGNNPRETLPLLK
ncbi:hypothetical protein HID58_023085 [Brassica napus]|uniref:Uncharacterized protein n=1 Tax=Brassica napus TaxID=3708 RepID=A0ABQ8D134_BRANA|nr:hypothetical protein HID58_023085 [Brassica napus]